MQSIFAKKTNNTLLYNQESTITYTEPNRTITIIPVEYISAEEIGNAHWISLDEIEKETTDPIKKTLRKHLFEGQVNIAQKLEYERKLKKNLATKTIILPIAYNANNKEWELLLYKKNDILQPLFLPEKYTNIPRKAKKITTLFHEHFDKNYPIEKKDIYAISDSIKNRHIYFSVIPYEQIPSCQWFSIQNSQQGKETDISQAVDIFLHSYLTTYKLPLEKFIAEHQRITTNITAKKIEELYKDLTALAASLI